ncbi:Nif3-like dinuclear metal center hexameric protein [Legionella jordanis]|uniref:GTP cyclohydrolase 1 type 2 homolog n=1 Tax=Legionella jordanis TaxID=456 RepID=A0A0W0V8W8_9GAMM|nr:putative NIF3-like protein 1 [Legionella jordanis]RMX04461.1 Nif3-like dinuclear metal center hexameric protein [Legionella jordanis]RMX21006.1 Nif3-like dinuclear metal center hexameric protein [Legionella jordanis]VEH12216.1 putative NIF3-like protein 1 [Legionella jordanis]
MIEREELTSYLHELLACANYQDYAPNGLQVEGKSEINSICTAVTASADVIEQAIAQKADALLVHHGYFWRGEDAALVGMKRQRIAKLLQHNISLFAYHLPLDCHLQLGNNACLAKLLNPDAVTMHRVGNTANLLWAGEFRAAKDSQEFAVELEQKFARKPIHIDSGPHEIRRIAWCTGAAQDLIEEAYKLGVDAFISGEISERTYYQAKELGVHYFSCGHHATERYGIQALGEHLESQFQVKQQFIDSPNPI